MGCGSWLKAYSEMSSLTWPCGQEESPAEHPINLDGARATLQLEALGRVESAQSYIFAGYREDRFAGVVQAAELIKELSFEDFVISIVMRIYGYDHGLGVEDALRSARGKRKAIETARTKLQSSQLALAKKPGTLILKDLVRTAATELADLLLTPEISEHAVHHGYMLHGGHFGMIGVVACETCRKRLLFRFWAVEPKKAVGARIYLIPGLKYQFTPFQGAVGPLMKSNRIVGRIIYGIRGCSCQRLESVQVV